MKKNEVNEYKFLFIIIGVLVIILCVASIFALNTIFPIATLFNNTNSAISSKLNSKSSSTQTNTSNSSTTSSKSSYISSSSSTNSSQSISQSLSTSKTSTSTNSNNLLIYYVNGIDKNIRSAEVKTSNTNNFDKIKEALFYKLTGFKDINGNSIKADIIQSGDSLCGSSWIQIRDNGSYLSIKLCRKIAISTDENGLYGNILKDSIEKTVQSNYKDIKIRILDQTDNCLFNYDNTNSCLK